jgi:hypothetical protein
MSQELPELAGCATTLTFGDIAGNGNSCTTNLRG